MSHKAYIEHRPTGKSIDLQKTNINSFTVNKQEFNFSEIIQFFVKNPNPFWIEIQKDLQAFHTQLGVYSEVLEDNSYYVPRNLVDTIDPANAQFPFFTDIDKFQNFYKHTLEISEQWNKIKVWLNDKNRKKTITDNLSTYFKEWDKKEYEFEASNGRHNFHNKTHWLSIRDREYTNYNHRNEKQEISFCENIQKMSQKQGLTYFYGTFTIPNAIEVGVFNIYDALYAVMGKNPFAKIMSSEIFSYPSTDFALAQAPSLQIPESASLFMVALRIPQRIPEDCWLKITGHGRQVFTDYKDNMNEATAFTSIEAARSASLEFDYRQVESSIVEFEAFSRKIHATPKSQKGLTQTLTSTIEARDLAKQVRNIPASSQSTTQTKPRHKI